MRFIRSYDEPSRPIVHYNCGGCCVRSIRYEGKGRQGVHCHEVSTVTLITGGAVLEESEAGSRHGSLGQVVIKPAGWAHADSYGSSGLATLQIRIDSEALQGVETMLKYGWFGGGPLVRTMFSLLQRFRSQGSAEDKLQSEVVAAMNLAIVESSAVDETSGPDWLSAIASELDRTFIAPISTSDMAQGMGIHRVSLARLFRQRYGCSITEYVRRKRVAATCAALEQSKGASLADIALQSGFADQSHLTHVFGRELGLSPARVRSLIG